MNAFVGVWVGPDEYTAEVEYTVTESPAGLSVAARDPSDGEIAEVSGISLSDGILSFAATWPSTGRVAECKLRVVDTSTIDLTFNYTDRARLVRRPA